MARIRVVKPEFWDDEKIATISRDARLTFIGIWNNSDDYGVVKGNSIWLKNKIFPYDEIKQKDFEKWIGEIEGIFAIIPFKVNSEKYYYIRTFTKHQTINRPSQTRNPIPPVEITEGSLSTHGRLTPEVEVEVEVEVEEKGKGKVAAGAASPPPPKIKHLDSVFLTASEYSKLQEAIGQKSLDFGIEKLNYSIAVKGGKYKDHYLCLLNWHKRGFLEVGGNGSGIKPTTYAQAQDAEKRAMFSAYLREMEEENGDKESNPDGAATATRKLPAPGPLG